MIAASALATHKSESRATKAAIERERQSIATLAENLGASAVNERASRRGLEGAIDRLRDAAARGQELPASYSISFEAPALHGGAESLSSVSTASSAATVVRDVASEAEARALTSELVRFGSISACLFVLLLTGRRLPLEWG